MNTTTWKILELGISDGVVVKARYQITKSDGQFSASTEGWHAVAARENVPVLSDVTEQIVSDWLNQDFDPQVLADIEQNLQNQLIELQTTKFIKPFWTIKNTVTTEGV